jgi:hypothetical protein
VATVGRRPHVYVHCGCLGCSVPLLAALAATAAAAALLGRRRRGVRPEAGQ